MIKVKFFIECELLTGFEVSGHSGSNQSGEDIICAAVSSAAYMAANTITEIIGDDADIKVKDGFLSLLTNKSSESQAILKGLQLHLTSLAQDYPENIKITT